MLTNAICAIHSLFAFASPTFMLSQVEKYQKMIFLFARSKCMYMYMFSDGFSPCRKINRTNWWCMIVTCSGWSPVSLNTVSIEISFLHIVNVCLSQGVCLMLSSLSTFRFSSFFFFCLIHRSISPRSKYTIKHAFFFL